MMDYDDAKQFFASKLGNDWFGKGRMESAFFHTADHIYQKGHADGVANAIAGYKGSVNKQPLSIQQIYYFIDEAGLIPVAEAFEDELINFAQLILAAATTEEGNK